MRSDFNKCRACGQEKHHLSTECPIRIEAFIGDDLRAAERLKEVYEDRQTKIEIRQTVYQK